MKNENKYLSEMIIIQIIIINGVNCLARTIRNLYPGISPDYLWVSTTIDIILTLAIFISIKSVSYNSWKTKQQQKTEAAYKSCSWNSWTSNNAPKF